MLILFVFISAVITAGCSGDVQKGSPSGSEPGSALTRLDENGYLYYMDYAGDYYSAEVLDRMKKQGILESGCSGFMTYNTEGEPISCKNYDVSHRVSKLRNLSY